MEIDCKITHILCFQKNWCKRICALRNGSKHITQMLPCSEVPSDDNLSCVFYVFFHISLQAHIIFTSQNSAVTFPLLENR